MECHEELNIIITHGTCVYYCILYTIIVNFLSVPVSYSGLRTKK